MDENVHGGIVRGLRRRGIDVLTAVEDGRAGTPDDQLLERSGQLNRLLFTCDEDLLAVAHWRQLAGEFFVGVVYAHKDRVSIGRCVEDLEIIASLSRVEEYHGLVTFLPL